MTFFLSKFHVYFVFIFLAFSMVSCQSEQIEKKPLGKVEVVEVIQMDVPIYEDFVGQIYGHVDIPIRARVNGFLEAIHFTEGRRVEKDQLLYSIDSQPYQAEVASKKSMLAEAKTELVRTKNELVRYEELIKTKSVSQSDYEAKLANAEAAAASVEAAEANVRMAEINLSYCTVLSPSDGVIGQTQAKVGEFVGKEPNPVILNTVSDIEDIRVNFFLTESQYLKVARVFMGKGGTKSGEPDSAKNNLELILSDGTKHEYKGNVDFINREVDASTGSMLVQASFPNPSGLLRPGQYAKVRVLFETEKAAMLIPERSLKELQGSYSLFTVNDSNQIQIRQVTIGEKYGDLRIIRSGISTNDKVVLNSTSGISIGAVAEIELVTFESKSL